MNLLSDTFLLAVFVLSMSILVAVTLHQYFKFLRNKNNKIEVGKKGEFCTLCYAQKSATDHLIAGQDGAVCADCLLNSVSLLDSENESDTTLGVVDKIIIEKLDRVEPQIDLDKNLVNYILERSDESENQRILILFEVLKRKNYYLTKLLLSKLPQDKWTHNDASNWIWANCMTGDFQEALKLPELESADDLLKMNDDERHLQVNKISLAIWLDESEENINKQLPALFEIKEYLESVEYPLPADTHILLPLTLSNIASCCFFLGDYDAARRYIDERNEIAEYTDAIQFLLGNISEKSGDMKSAEAHWALGLKLESRGIYRDKLSEKLGILHRADSTR